MVSIAACTTAREHKTFERLPEFLHGRNPGFAPPFPGSIVKYLSSKSAFHRRHGKIHPFVALRDGKPVGRIAAIVNRSHNEHYKDRTGFFGFFECEDNEETAKVLFAKAASVLRENGLECVRGPYNPSINDECGLLINGFERPPCIGLTWNPPYYEKLLISAGFQAVRYLQGYDLPLHRLEPPERLSKIVARVAKRARVKLRPINLQDLKKELEIVHEVYNATLERNWGFVPIAMEDLLEAADDMRAIADPEMILIAEIDGENAGVAISLPNFNEILYAVKTTPHWLRLLHIAWLMKTRRINSGRQTVYGISPRFRDKGGLHGWLLLEQFTCAKARYHDAELGWIEENNTEIRENADMLGAIPYRAWRLFEKSLV